MRTLLFILLLAATPVLFAQQAQPHNLKEQPLLFLENKGQVLDFDNNPRPDVLFMMRAKGINVFVGKGELHYLFSQPKAEPEVAPKSIARVEYKEPDPYAGEAFIENMPDTTPTIYETYRIDISLIGMNPDAVVEALEQDLYYENYYNIPGHYTEGILNVRSFGKIIMRNVYPNIDWILYSRNGKLKHEFLLHPGADHRNIRIAVKGATDMVVNANGELELSTPQGTIVEDKPFIPENPEIQGIFLLNKVTDLEYEIGYDLEGVGEINTNITIDPGIEWSTYFGGNGHDYGNSVSESNGLLYFGGFTASSTQISYKGFQSTRAGNYDMFIARFAENGTRNWATYFGGPDQERLYSLKAIHQGVVVCGLSHSGGLGYLGFDTSYYTNTADGIILFLNANGSRRWSTYFGGNGNDYLNDIDTLANGSFALTGYTSSTGMATVGVHQTVNNGNLDAFASSIDSSGQFINWYSYLGGSGPEFCYALTTINNDMYIAGTSQSADYYCSKGFQDTSRGGSEGFIAQFDSIGRRVWSSFYGTASHDGLRDITSFQGSLYITAYTRSFTGLAYGNAYKIKGDFNDATLARITKDGKIIWSTYFGDDNEQFGRSLAVDNNGIIWWLLTTSGTGGKLGKNLYFDKALGTYDGAFLLERFDTSCNYIDGTYYYGFLSYWELSPAFNPPLSAALAYDGDNEVYTCHSDLGSGFTVRSKYQSTYNDLTDAMFIKWSIHSVSKPKLENQWPICQGGKLNIIYTQNAVGRGKAGKTYLELSDSNGVFNNNTITVFTRNDTISQIDTVVWTIPENLATGKYYRLRAIMSSPSDTSESSDFINIQARPTGKVLPISSNQICLTDSIKLEIDSQGPNKIRWYYKSSPTASSADTTKVYFAKQSGKYYAVLTNPIGCTYATNSISITAWPNPLAGYRVSDSALCFNVNTFTFTDTSKPYSGDVITKFQWYFGDGQTSTSTNPTKSYSAPGTYVVKLGIGTQRGCHDTAYQTINVWPEPVAKIHKDTSLQCLRGNKFTFTDSSEILADSISKREWRIGSSLVNTQTQFQHSFTSTGTYSISLDVETAHGCKDNTSTSVRVSGNPIADIQASKAGFCPGDSVKLEVTNPNTWNYQWYESGNKIGDETKTLWHTKAGGNYSVRATTNDGCDTVSNVVKVSAYLNPKPDLGADRTIKYDSSVVLNPGTFKNYAWNKGVTTNTFTANKTNLDTGNNTLWVLVTDSNGCKGSDTVMVRLEPINSIKNIAFSGIKIYPVPAENILHIEFPFWNNPVPPGHDLSPRAYQFNLVSFDGRTVLSGALTSQNTALDISALAAGTYLLELDLHGEKFVAKVVK